MIGLAILVILSPASQSGELLRNEETVSQALDAHLQCVASHTFDQRNEPRSTSATVAELRRSCASSAGKLNTALIDLYRRKPALLETSQTPEGAAQERVEETFQFAQTVSSERQTKKQ